MRPSGPLRFVCSILDEYHPFVVGRVPSQGIFVVDSAGGLGRSPVLGELSMCRKVSEHQTSLGDGLA